MIFGLMQRNGEEVRSLSPDLECLEILSELINTQIGNLRGTMDLVQ